MSFSALPEVGGLMTGSASRGAESMDRAADQLFGSAQTPSAATAAPPAAAIPPIPQPSAYPPQGSLSYSSPPAQPALSTAPPTMPSPSPAQASPSGPANGVFNSLGGVMPMVNALFGNPMTGASQSSAGNQPANPFAQGGIGAGGFGKMTSLG